MSQAQRDKPKARVSPYPATTKIKLKIFKFNGTHFKIQIDQETPFSQVYSQMANHMAINRQDLYICFEGNLVCEVDTPKYIVPRIYPGTTAIMVATHKPTTELSNTHEA